MKRQLINIFKHNITWRKSSVIQQHERCYFYMRRQYHISSSTCARKLPLADYNNQSKTIEGSDVRLSKLCPGNDPVVSASALNECKTVYDFFKQGVQISGDNPFLGWRGDQDAPYQWLSYNEVDIRSYAFGNGLLKLGLSPENDTRIGIYSQNSKENVIAELGMMRNSMCSVPIYNDVVEKNLTYIINHADISTIACDSNSKIERMLKIRKQVPELNTIISYEPVKNAIERAAKIVGINVLHIHDVEELGNGNNAVANLPKPDDLATVCYTSGTTGQPKGVMLTHSNLVAVVCGMVAHLDWCDFVIRPDDSLISYLPTAHIYQRFLEIAIMGAGARIGYWYGNRDRISLDCQELKPTILPAVPRLLNRVYDRTLVHVRRKSSIEQNIFQLGLYWKQMLLKRSIIRNDTWADKLVFGAVTSQLGGKVKIVCTGSAPVSAKVLSNLQCILGCPIIEGYGLTECSGLAAAAIKGDPKSGHVGPPMPSTIIKLVDVPEMDYFVRNNEGEICLKGPTIFKGYLKQPEKDEEVFLEDNWIRTGDIGTWTENGCLKIKDRRKHIFKLSQGMFIAPEKIENMILRSPYVMQVFVYGDGFRDDIVCIAVPDKEAIEDLKNELGLSGSYEDLLKNEQIKQVVLKDLQRISQENRLNNLETVKDVYLHPEEFSSDNGFLTPTMKMKRGIAKERFRQPLDEMFKKLDDEKLQKRLGRESLAEG